MPSLLIETALKAAALLAICAALVLLLRRSPARLRVMVWTAALGGILLLPVAASLLPGLRVPLPDSLSLGLPLSNLTPSPAPVTVGEPIRIPAALVVPGEFEPDLAASAGLPRALPSRATVAGWLLAVWLGGVTVVLGRLGADWLRVRALLAHSRPAPAAWAPLLAAAQSDLGVSRPVRLRVCAELALPATVGWLRPAILLPEAAGDWSFDRRSLVLQHELLHVARLDWAARILAGLACAVHWFDPLAWWARRRLALEQELACDQEILAGGVQPSAYAFHLLEIARGAATRPAPTASVLEMARPTHLEERIMAILKGRTRRRTGIAAATAAALALLLVFPVLAAMEVAAPEPPAPPAPRTAPATPRPVAAVPAVAPAPEAPLLAARAPAAPAPEPTPEPPEAPEEPATVVRTASPRLSRLLAEIRELEARLETRMEPIQEIEERMRPQLREIEAMEVELDDEERGQLEQELETLGTELEERMRPHLEALEAEMALLEERLAERGVERGEAREHRHVREKRPSARMQAREAELAERAREREERMRPHREALERELAPLQERLAKRSAEMAALDRDELQRIQEAVRRIEPLTEEIQKAQEGLQPLIDQMTELAEEIKAEMVGEVETILRRRFEPVIGDGAPYAETARELVETSQGFNIDDELVRLEIERGATREILTDRLGPAPRDGREAFKEAVAAASRDLSRLEVRLERR